MLVRVPTMRLLTGSSAAHAASEPLSPFVPAHRVITPAQTGRDCLAAHGATHCPVSKTRRDRRVRAFARNTARIPPSPTQATLPHYGVWRYHRRRLRATARWRTIRSRWSLINCLGSATFTWSTRPGTGLPQPAAAVVPALASVFDSKVTWLGRVTARSARVCAASRQAILS